MKMVSVEAMFGILGSRRGRKLVVLIRFDIDGTMEFGDHPGGVTVEKVPEWRVVG